MDAVDRMIELAKEKKINQQELASAVGVTEDTVSNWFRRKSASYTKYLTEICTALNTTVVYLLNGTGPKTIEPAVVSNSDTQNEGQLMAAFFEGGQDLSEEEMAALWQDAKDYIQWKLSQRRKAKDDQ